MKKLHKQVIARQAQLLDRMFDLFEVSRLKKFRLCNEAEYRKMVIINNRKFNPAKMAMKGLSVGQKAAIVRDLVNLEMRGVTSSYSLLGWANTYDMKNNIRELLIAMKVIPEFSNDVSHVTRKPRVTITTHPWNPTAKASSLFEGKDWVAHAEL